MVPNLRSLGCVKVYADSLRKTIRLLTRIYLRNLALPALQLYAAYLPKRDLMSIGLMVGMFSRQN